MKHAWVRSTLGHGEQMCSTCFITDREAAALGKSLDCDGEPAQLKTPTREPIEESTCVHGGRIVDCEDCRVYGFCEDRM